MLMKDETSESIIACLFILVLLPHLLLVVDSETTVKFESDLFESPISSFHRLNQIKSMFCSFFFLFKQHEKKNSHASHDNAILSSSEAYVKEKHGEEFFLFQREFIIIIHMEFEDGLWSIPFSVDEFPSKHDSLNNKTKLIEIRKKSRENEKHTNLIKFHMEIHSLHWLNKYTVCNEIHSYSVSRVQTTLMAQLSFNFHSQKKTKEWTHRKAEPVILEGTSDLHS